MVPFSTERLKRLYKNPVKYVQKVKKRTRKLRKRGFLLREDAELILDGAVNSNVACGLGFELVIVVPAAMWLRRRVRAGRRD